MSLRSGEKTRLRPLEARAEFRLVRTLDAAAGERDGAEAFRQFCLPALSSRRAADHERQVERARFHLRAAQARRIRTTVGEIQTYTFAPDGEAAASVLLVHGWTGEAAFMGAFAGYLRRRGLRCLLMDLPGHGRSDGAETTLLDCARAVLEVAEALAPVRFALGHSIGAMAALLAGEGRRPIPRAAGFEAYVLVAMPDRFADVTREFGTELGLSPAAQRDFERRLERLAERRLADFTGTRLLAAAARPTLLLHARDDCDVPFAAAERMAGAVDHAALQAFDGLGHRAILYAPPAVRAAAAFLGQRLAAG